MLKYIIRKLKENRGNLGSLFGGGKDNQVANVPAPTFQVDPNFTSSQNNLATLGQQVLSGNLPSFYSNLGKPNSPQFQAMISNITGQTQQAAQNQEALSGTGRSGVGAAASALALNNIIPGLNYQDLLNSQQQQQGLLSFGANVTQDVAGNALSNQSQENQFGLNLFQDKMQQAEYNNQFNANAAQQKGQAIDSLISAGLDLGLAPFTGGASLLKLPGVLGAGGGSGEGMMASGFGSLLSSLGKIGSNVGSLTASAPGYTDPYAIFSENP